MFLLKHLSISTPLLLAGALAKGMLSHIHGASLMRSLSHVQVAPLLLDWNSVIKNATYTLINTVNTINVKIWHDGSRWKKYTPYTLNGNILQTCKNALYMTQLEVTMDKENVHLNYNLNHLHVVQCSYPLLICVFSTFCQWTTLCKISTEHVTTTGLPADLRILKVE